MDEEEILSPREIAIIDRWMEKHQVGVEEPIFKGPWELSLVEAVVSAGVSDKRSEIAELPEKLWTKIEEIWERAYLDCKTYAGVAKARGRLWELLPPSGREAGETVLKDGDLQKLGPTQRKMVERHLRGIIAGVKRQLTQRALGEVMEERDNLQKTLMEERRRWKEERRRWKEKR